MSSIDETAGAEKAEERPAGVPPDAPKKKDPVLSGAVKACKWDSRGRELILGMEPPGAAVGEILRAFPGKVQLGGGIRNRDSIERWLSLGVSRVVIGTAALENPELVREAARDFPGQIVVAVDARDGMVATRGWADVSTVSVVELARRFEDAGVAALLFTDVGRDGLLKGCNVEATVTLARAVSIPVIASGGVTDVRDIQALRPHVADGIEGVITGRALYDGRLDLAEAIEAAR